MTLQRLVLTFTREGIEIRTRYPRRFFETYTGLKRWHDDERRAWQRGRAESRTLTGRRCTNVERLTDRLNAPVQGTAADGLKLALVLLLERRSECPGTVAVLVCHDGVVVECDAKQAEGVKVWLEQAMIEGMEAILNGTDEGHVSVEVEGRIARSWGKDARPNPQQMGALYQSLGLPRLHGSSENLMNRVQALARVAR